MAKPRWSAAALLLCCASAWPLAGQTPPPERPVSAGASAQGRGPGGRERGGPARTRTRKVVLAWADTRNGIAQHDSTSHALAVIERLGYESGA